MLPFQKLDVYRCSLEFFRLAHGLAERCPPGQKELVDQLRRASLSIQLNLAEGNGKFGRDGKRFFQISRGSVMECGAIYDACLVLGLIDPNEHQQALVLLERIAAMLSKMIQG